MILSPKQERTLEASIQELMDDTYEYLNSRIDRFRDFSELSFNITHRKGASYLNVDLFVKYQDASVGRLYSPTDFEATKEMNLEEFSGLLFSVISQKGLKPYSSQEDKPQ
jgi:hypothetical protein